jgi:hypothetical protein
MENEKKYAVIGQWIDPDGTEHWDILSNPNEPITLDEAKYCKELMKDSWLENAPITDRINKETIITWEEYQIKLNEK